VGCVALFCNRSPLDISSSCSAAGDDPLVAANKGKMMALM
jgi:hypothetical protein